MQVAVHTHKEDALPTLCPLKLWLEQNLDLWFSLVSYHSPLAKSLGSGAYQNDGCCASLWSNAWPLSLESNFDSSHLLSIFPKH